MISGNKNLLVGFVKTVVPLTEEQYSSLVSKLEAKYGKKIELKQEIDKSIVGGLFIQVENEFIDATINSQYQEMKELMLNRK
ncbi:F0F1 ATP synthase subunit delta [uncultured Clostridium sp.]|jgi:F-type H+-transporting ATPase subunit delta|uniref:F0F1 ATP synthase subunit delta n=1 Tax=uncultured Clostridium sp. TaxID=59620 RepID=UPI002609EB19|nr:F0F1 ATP synthase subunit delta [uncultured Clostridium sp.]